MTGKAKLVIGHHTDNYECNEAYTYLIGRINAGRVRYFPGYPETMGDTHYDQFMNPTQIHVQKDLFGGQPATPTQTSDDHELAMTLYHEAYHSINSYWPHTDNDAELFALSCVTI